MKIVVHLKSKSESNEKEYVHNIYGIDGIYAADYAVYPAPSS
ncbi:MAG: hypothetical protein ACOYJK_00150 [Prevotella sp.]